MDIGAESCSLSSFLNNRIAAHLGDVLAFCSGLKEE